MSVQTDYVWIENDEVVEREKTLPLLLESLYHQGVDATECEILMAPREQESMYV
jgi:hypothetical protein